MFYKWFTPVSSTPFGQDSGSDFHSSTPIAFLGSFCLAIQGIGSITFGFSIKTWRARAYCYFSTVISHLLINPPPEAEEEEKEELSSRE